MNFYQKMLLQGGFFAIFQGVLPVVRALKLKVIQKCASLRDNVQKNLAKLSNNPPPKYKIIMPNYIKFKKIVKI